MFKKTSLFPRDGFPNITLSLHYIYDNIHDNDADSDGNHVNVMSRNFQVFLSVERGDLGILKAIGIQDSQVLIILSPQVKYMFIVPLGGSNP